MFNNRLKKDAITSLGKIVDSYDYHVKFVRKASLTLFELREKSGDLVIKPVENYINKLSNSPKEFDKSFSEYKAEFAIFNEVVESFNAEAVSTDYKAGSTALAGVFAGAGTATLMPTAAMAIATTFGTASTGTAISTLSGAVATKAALAWLGGGALAAGGGGMAGGSALLALAGPIGIGIGAVGIIGGGLFAYSKNKKIAQEANEKRKEIYKANLILKASKKEIGELIALTRQHQSGVLKLLRELDNIAPDNYASFNELEKHKLGALVNHITSLSALLNKKVA